MSFKLLNRLRTELCKISDDEIFHEDDTTVINLPKLKVEDEVLRFIKKSRFLRSATEEEIISLFNDAYTANPEISLKGLFYSRDIVEGYGERRAFRIIIKFLALKDPEIMKKNIELIPKYGRYDDLYSLFDTPLQEDVIRLFKTQLEIDKFSSKPSNLAKWLKSENASSFATKNLARKTREALGLTSKEYRVLLSSLRKKIDIVESKMASGEWNKINYYNIPFEKCLRLKNSFIRHDSERFSNYLKDQVESKRKNLFSSSMTSDVENAPYQIIDTLYKIDDPKHSEIFDNLWKLIPDYRVNKNEDFIVINGVSLDGVKRRNKSFNVALSTMLYTQQFNQKPLKNYFLYYKENAKFGKIVGESFYEKVSNLKNIGFMQPKNIISAVDLLLYTMFKKSMYKEQAPQNILVITDMNVSEEYENSEVISKLLSKWKISGYGEPNLIFWQVEDYDKQMGIKKDKNNVLFAYGYSELLYKFILLGKEVTIEEYVVESLQNERYSDINFK